MDGRKKRIAYTRVLVEVDVAKDIVKEVSIKLPKERIREQYIVYEKFPKYCSTFQAIGHSSEVCKKKEQP